MIATDVAAGGTLQSPVTGKLLGEPGESAGPPEGPVGSRVSRMRQGVTVKKLFPAGGFVGLGVGVFVGVGVGVFVGVLVAVGVGVCVAIGVLVGVLGGVFVGVALGVLVGV